MRTGLDRYRHRRHDRDARRECPGGEDRLVAIGRQVRADLARPRQAGLGIRDTGGASHPVGRGQVPFILYPPGAADGWDAADAIAEGFDVAAFLAHGPRCRCTTSPTTLSRSVGR